MQTIFVVSFCFTWCSGHPFVNFLKKKKKLDVRFEVFHEGMENWARLSCTVLPLFSSLESVIKKYTTKW